MLATFYSWTGEETERNRTIKQWISRKMKDSLALNNYVIKEAKTYILSLTKNADVVMFNEDHFNPENRLFFSQMLDSLYNQGFKDLFVETLDYRETSGININSGYYSKEPEFGKMLKRAAAIGFNLIAYEDTLISECKSDCNNFRDSVQAKNITDYFTKNNRKILVYAGHSHIDRRHTGNWKRMAERFEENTGEKILSIEQAQLSNFGNASHAFSIYLNDNYPIIQPSVLFVNDEPFRLRPAYHDIQVVFPTKNDEWKKENRIKSTITLNPYFKGRLLYIYPEKENITRLTIPYCIKKIDTEHLDVFLEKGNYKYIIVDRFGESSFPAERLSAQ
jgi:hypothetical protein